MHLKAISVFLRAIINLKWSLLSNIPLELVGPIFVKDGWLKSRYAVVIPNLIAVLNFWK